MMLTLTCTVARCRSAVGTTCLTSPRNEVSGYASSVIFAGPLFPHSRDVRLVDVDLDLERREIGHRHHRAAGQAAAHRRCHDLADLGLLAEHGAGERRADHRVLQVGPGEAEAGLRRLRCRASDASTRAAAWAARLSTCRLLLRDQLRVLARMSLSRRPPARARRARPAPRPAPRARSRGRLRLRRLGLVVGVLQQGDDLAAAEGGSLAHPRSAIRPASLAETDARVRATT